MRHTLRIVTLAFALGGLSATPADAWAKSSASIEAIGIDSFDEVFNEVKVVDDILTDARKKRHRARKKINNVLEIDKSTAFTDALAELSARAEGKITVAMNGSTPTLKATDAVPTNVQEAIDAVNSAANLYVGLLKSLEDIPPQVKSVSKKAKKLKMSDLKDELGGFKLSEWRERLDQVKQFKTNLEVAGKLPDKSKKLITNLGSDVKAVSSAFSG